MVPAQEYLNTISSRNPAIAETVNQLKDFHSRKLWHQLFLATDHFVHSANGPKGADLVDFYENFVKDFQNKLSMLRLADLAVFIARQQDHDKAFAFLEPMKDIISKDEEALLFLKGEMTRLRLHKNAPIEEIKDEIEEIAKKIESSAHLDNKVHAMYYYLLSQFHKKEYSAREFFKNSLLYLAYTPSDSITEDEKVKISFEVGVAALLGDGIYNFGELLGNTVFKSLSATHEWLYEMLGAFNTGDVSKYEDLMKKHEGAIAMQAESFLENKKQLREKISLMAVMETVFRRAADERVLSFDEIGKAAKIDKLQVEHIVMKAMSRKLVRGTIDEVAEKVTFTWVQPRVLDKDQIVTMKDKLDKWTEQVKGTTLFLEQETPELFV